MSTLNEAPLVELTDAFGEDDFVGPPPGSSYQTSSSQVQSDALKRSSRLRQSIARRPPQPPPTSDISDEGPTTINTEPVPYTPNHPSLITVNLPDQQRPARSTPSRRGTRRPQNGNVINDPTPPAPIQYQPPTIPAASVVRPQLSNEFLNRPNLRLPSTTTRPPTNLTPQPAILRQQTAPRLPNAVDNLQAPSTNYYPWPSPMYQPRFGGGPNFTTFGNGTPQSQTNFDWRTQYLNQMGQPSSRSTSNNLAKPAPAHAQTSNRVGANPVGIPSKPQIPTSASVFTKSQSGLNSLLAHSNSVPPIPNRTYSNRMYRPTLQANLNPQAAPVRPAYEDFLRQVQAAIPGVDVNELLHAITSNPSQAIQISVPNGVNTAVVQQQLQQSLETSMLHALNQANTSQAQMPYYPNTSDNQNRAPRVVPPTEDDMAEQDKDADANHDEEYHEVETYADYTPAKLTIGQPHPDPVVETSSLSTVEPPNINYQLKLPAKVIDNGYLSALQLESVIYACQQHNQLLADGRTRKGFLIGDGAGVGKGRTIAGIIYENYLCGRKKSIWLSVSTDLKLDAERDLKDIGAKIPVYLLGKFTYGRRINVDSGVLFTTYSGLVSKSQTVRGPLGSRIGQIVAWAGSDFDGVIVFDECHKAKNISMTKNKKTQSKAAEFAQEIQNRLPKARVVYASATGASETKHLGYMTRLGIWGEGTPYRTFSQFCGAIEKRGVGAMELVAVDLKMRGSYIARQLSFKTTSFEIRVASLDKSFIELYDECVEMWAKALHAFTEAANYFCGDKKRSRVIWASFWAAHQKFFKYLCIGAKVPLVIQIAKEALENGKCVVIGLQSTGEAKTMEALEDGDINEFLSTARATFESLIENHFPAPYKPKRFNSQKSICPEKKIHVQTSDKTSGTSSTASGGLSTSDSSSTIDESWHGHEDVKFVVENGVVKAQLEEDKLKKSRPKRVATKRFAKNQDILNELAEAKRLKTQLRKKSSRALRAERRAVTRGDKKSRIRLPEVDSDTELSNPLSSCSSDGLPTTSSGTAIGSESAEDSDKTYHESDVSEDYLNDEEDECSSTTIESDNSGSEISVTGAKRQRPASSSDTGSSKKQTLDSDSDSDVVITAVKPRKQYDIIFLSSDEEGDEGDKTLDRNDPLLIHGKRLSEMKDQLLEMIDKLGPKLPNNTLDDLIDRLGGASKVAEMTGRKGRIVKDVDGQISYRHRNEDDALENLNVAEKERFMKGEKLVAIISEAASSGISLQADKRVANKKRRVHITIELPWSADRAIQQFGRTHRSNQVCGPEYVFIISELAGEKRFASIVAKRLESLGALTHGDRRATTESRDLSQFNIVGRFCKQALEHVCLYIERSVRFAGMQPDYPNGNFIRDAQEAFVGAGLARQTGSMFVPETQATQINHFLNRLLGMKVGIQNALFKLFTDYMDRLIMRKKVAGQYDAGILELNSVSGKTHCDPPEDFYLKVKSSGIVKCTLRNVQVERGISWEEAVNLLEASDDTRSGFYVSTNPITKAKMVFLALREPQSVDQFRAYKPNTGRHPKVEHYSILTETAMLSRPGEAEKIWRKVFEATNTKCVHSCFFNSCKRKEAKLKCDVGLRHRKYCILSGGILTAWPYLEKRAPEVTAKLQIVRLKLDSSNRVIGPIIPQDYLDLVRSILKKGEEGVEF